MKNSNKKNNSTLNANISTTMIADIIITTGKSRVEVEWSSEAPKIIMEVGETSIQCSREGAEIANKLAQDQHERDKDWARFTAQGVVETIQYVKDEVPSIMAIIRREYENQSNWLVKVGRKVSMSYHKMVVRHLKSMLKRERSRKKSKAEKE